MDSKHKIVNLPDEEWRDVVGFEGLYCVSNMGRCASLRSGEMRLINPRKNPAGYMRIAIHVRPMNKQFMVHRLVAETFIPNPNNLPFVNHKDENTSNNSVDNLEWCDRRYNNTYGTALSRAHETRKKNGHARTVYQYDLDGNYIAEYSSAYKAFQETGVNKAVLYGCLVGDKISAGGFFFVRDKSEIPQRIEKMKKGWNKVRYYHDVLPQYGVTQKVYGFKA